LAFGTSRKDRQMKFLLAVLGMLCVLIGGLWLVQGLGLVTVAPILCFADCAPLVGPSAPWAAAGLVALALGLLALRRARRRPPR
jgi:hypothetical protein